MDLYNIFLRNLYLIIDKTEFASYVDGNTLYDAENTILTLQESSKNLFKYFPDNKMQGSSGKCHLIFSTDELTEMQVGEYLIKSANREKLFGIKIDSKLDKH